MESAGEAKRILTCRESIMANVPQPIPSQPTIHGLSPPVQVPLVDEGTHVPSQYQTHPLIDGRYFFTLPKELLDDVVNAVGENYFDPKLLKLESELSSLNGDHSAYIGFRAGHPIPSNLLGPGLNLESLLHDVTPAMRAELGWALTPQNSRGLQTASDRLESDKEICRAYCGWLVSNPQFINEQKAFLAKWEGTAKRFGLDAPVPDDDDPVRHTIPTYVPFTQERDQFLEKWQLTGLSGPLLPKPPMRHAPLSGGKSAVLPNPGLGTTFFFPSIFPMPNRQELLRMVDEAME